MTEIGMALSNPLNPDDRMPGCVGLPMPSVEVALAGVSEEGEGRGNLEEVIFDPVKSKEQDSLPGELLIAGPSVFSQYWNKPKETRSTFTADGRWFKTGDTAIVENGVFRILGMVDEFIYS